MKRIGIIELIILFTTGGLIGAFIYLKFIDKQRPPAPEGGSFSGEVPQPVSRQEKFYFVPEDLPTDAYQSEIKAWSRVREGSIAIPAFKPDFDIQMGQVNKLEQTADLKNLSSPRISPDGKQIVFSAGNNGNRHIFRIGLDNSNLIQLTFGSGDDIDPSWMTDGHRVIYASNKTGKYELWLMDQEGKYRGQITKQDGTNKTHPRCSPLYWYNGDYWDQQNPSKHMFTVIYQCEEEQDSDIWLVGEDGSNPVNLTKAISHQASYTNPEWSPNGLTILYNAEDVSFIKACEGWNFGKRGAANAIPDLGFQANACYPQFLPNQTRITFVNNTQNASSLFYAASDGSSIKEIKLKTAVKGPVAWSSDGETIAFVASDKNLEMLCTQKVKYPMQHIENLWQYPAIKSNQIDKLAANHFVVTGVENNMFHTGYETNKYPFDRGYEIPSFITSDSCLELFHLYFDYTLRTLEEERLSNALDEFLAEILTKLEEEMRRPECGPNILQDLKIWQAYFQTGKMLMKMGAQQAEATERQAASDWDHSGEYIESPETMPDENPLAEIPAEPAIKEELQLIIKHAGREESPILKREIDYTQFTVRGHYGRNAKLKAYFQTMMWLNQCWFSLKKDEPVDLIKIRQVMLLLDIIRKSPALYQSWEALYSAVTYFTGESEDLTVAEAGKLQNRLFTNGDLNALDDPALQAKYAELLGTMPPPRIVPKTGVNFRVFPQRFTPDSHILQSLVFTKEGNEIGTPENPRLLPKGLDIMAVFGSERAFEILDKIFGETRYRNYTEILQKTKNEYSRISSAEWQTNMYWGWLFVLKSFLTPADTTMPMFMRTQAWLDKSLNTALASWAELRHDTLLYVKQFSAEGGEGGLGWEPIIPKPKGYVEPNLLFYERLSSLMQISLMELKKQEMLDSDAAKKAGKYLEIVKRLGVISRKELNQEIVTDDDYQFMRQYGAEMEYLTAFFKGGTVPFYENEGQVALIADVGSDGQIQMTFLHEAVGKVRSMLVEVEIENKKQLNQGGVFTYYEFPVPGKRLNDREWREMLRNKQAPPLPVWTDSYTAE